MAFLSISFLFFLGLVVGSFLNVVALRYNSGRSIGGRSFCFSCSARLPWFDMIPLLSFVLLLGRCRVCASKMSLQYPLVELIVGIIFLLVGYRVAPNFDLSILIYNLPFLIFYFVVFSILIVISIYDLWHKIIPDALVYTFAFLSLLRIVVAWFLGNSGAIFGFGAVHNIWSSIAVGPLLALPFVCLWGVSKGTWMGLGDAKLALGVGWLLGFALGISALMFAFWLGAIYGIALIIYTRVLLSKPRWVTMKSEIPFGPFVVTGAIIVFLFEFNLMQVFRL